MSRAPDVAALAVVAVGVAIQAPAAERALSTFFAWALPVAGGLLLLGWLGREAWHAARDWAVFGPPDLRPLRQRKTRIEREEARDR